VIFTVQRGKKEMREVYTDIKARMKRGRDPGECAILPGVGRRRAALAVHFVLSQAATITRANAEAPAAASDSQSAHSKPSIGLPYHDARATAYSCFCICQR